MDEITSSSARSLADAIRVKELSSREIVEAYLARIDEVNDRLNAVVQVTGERALAEAHNADEMTARGESKGPLHGVPMTIKDSLDTEGIITTGGTTGRASFVPKMDSTVVARLRAAGAVLLGKTNTPELTYAGETDNLVYGRTNNPYDLSRTPGGSSGGPPPSLPRAARRSTWAATPAEAFASRPTSPASPASSPPRAGYRGPGISSPSAWALSTR